MKTIGITTTVPIEVLIAAGHRVVDLNNLFISSTDYDKYLDNAERNGFPKSCCAWIKGIYSACIKNKIDEIIGVTEGDCSNTKALIEVLKAEGVKAVEFTYPHSHSMKDIRSSINSLMQKYNVTLEQVETVRVQLNHVRDYAKTIDRLTYEYNKATGFENHICQITLSDFDGNIDKSCEMLKTKIKEIEKRYPRGDEVRLGYIGVPPMTADIYEYAEKFSARFVYNEVQREFAFPRANESKSIYEQYFDYTYPYDMNFRLNEIKKQLKLRKLDGIIHYTQAFCHRAIEDIVIKRELDLPILTIEGDKLNHLDSRTKLRLEAFLDMLRDRKGAEK